MRFKTSKFNYYLKKDKGYIITNTITGNISFMSDKERFNLENDLERFSERELKMLYENGFIVKKNFDEVGFLRFLYQRRKKDKCARIVICPTLKCNFRCPYCFQEHSFIDMNLEVEELVYDFISKLSKVVEEVSITFFGGEPLLYPKKIELMTSNIYSIAKNSNIKIQFSIITNGYNINNDIIRLFKRYNFGSIQITLDGDPETHDQRRVLVNGQGTFNRIYNNIVSLNENEIITNIRVNIDKNNLNSYPKVRSIFHDMKYVECYPALITEESTQSDNQRKSCFHNYETLIKNRIIDIYNVNYDEIFNQKHNVCMAESDLGFCIAPNGNVFKCINDLENDDMKVFSLYDNEWKNDIISMYLGRDPFTEFECSGCSFIPLCYGGCLSFYHKNNYHRCDLLKELLPKLMVLYYEKYKEDVKL